MTTFYNIPGVYSKIDASAAVQAGASDAVIGIVAQASTGEVNKAYAPSSFEDAKTIYGADSNVVKLMEYSLKNGANKFIVVKTDGKREVASLKITSLANTSSTVTITLDGVATTVDVLGTDTVIQVAAKIRLKPFPGWTTSGSGDTVIFTSLTSGVKTDTEYTPGTTGAAGTITTVVQGDSIIDYQAALDVLELEEAVSIVLVDSTDAIIHGMVKTHCINASDSRKERVAFIGLPVGTDIASAKTAVQVLNSGLLYVAYPNPLDIDGNEVSGIFCAAAIAGVDAAEKDPSMPLTNLQPKGFYGLAKKLKDSEQSDLIDAGIIPLESRNGDIRIIRMVSTYTKDALGVTDITWQERTTVKISHYLFKDMRADLTRRFSRAKQNAKSRESVKTAVVNRLKFYEGNQYIENVLDTDVSITINATVPTRNDVDFKYDVVTPMNVITLTGHLVI